ncbi:MAG: type II toxin-antitoxin system YafQ family toxin [Coriobacteriales bacterium]|jgi:mRNA interferase YafQ|nr:type II toxin-antitoxin system YafQ family toxin [Coriobacteriales bacterium]
MDEPYQVRRTKAFKKDLRRIIRQGKDLSEMENVVDDIAAGKVLDAKYQDHALTGNWNGFRDCHIAPDWMLIYKLEKQVLTLTLTRTGSHAELEL